MPYVAFIHDGVIHKNYVITSSQHGSLHTDSPIFQIK